MALISTQDYKNALYEVIDGLSKSVGFDPESYVRRFNLTEENKRQILQEYQIYKNGLAGRIDRTTVTIH